MDTAAVKVLGNAAIAQKRAYARGVQRTKDSARHAKQNAYISRNVAKRKRAPKGTGTCLTAPWNRLTPESEMRLYLCDSVKATLRELDNLDYEARYGK